MFANTLRQAARTGLARRAFSTAFPKKGISQGGHPDMRQHEKNFIKTWLKEPAAWPVAFCTLFAVFMGSTKLIFFDTRSPAAHWSKEERGSIDFLENDRTVEHNEKWLKTIWRAGIHKLFPVEWKFTKDDGRPSSE